MWNPNYFYVLGQWVGTEKPADTGCEPKINGSGDYLLPNQECIEAYYAGMRDAIKGEDIGILGYHTGPQVRKDKMRIAWITSHSSKLLGDADDWPTIYVDIDRLGIDTETDYEVLDPNFKDESPFRMWVSGLDDGTWVPIEHS